jgi:CreA protein
LVKLEKLVRQTLAGLWKKGYSLIHKKGLGKIRVQPFEPSQKALEKTPMKKFGIILGGGLLLVIILFGWWLFSRPDRGSVGSVSTQFRWLGPNDKIVIDGFDDPKVQGVACHISRAQTGGVKGELGVAEDTSDVSIACRQIGPIQILGDLKDGERVFDEKRSLVFKKLQVVRFFDRERNVLVYVAYSDRVITGSPKNSISTVPIMRWPAP